MNTLALDQEAEIPSIHPQELQIEINTLLFKCASFIDTLDETQYIAGEKITINIDGLSKNIVDIVKACVLSKGWDVRIFRGEPVLGGQSRVDFGPYIERLYISYPENMQTLKPKPEPKKGFFAKIFS